MCAQRLEQHFRLNPANSSIQCSPQHTPITHLRIAWTYSESLCCCAFKVTPIAVSGTERGSLQNWSQTIGVCKILNLEEILPVPKTTPKSVQKPWTGGRYNLPGTRGPEGGSYSLNLARVWAFLASVDICLFNSKPSQPVNKNSFFLFIGEVLSRATLTAGLKKKIHWVRKLSGRAWPKLFLLMCVWKFECI